jgi:cell division transport system permease protein
MGNWLAQHRLALGVTLRRLARAPFSSLLTMTVIGVALSLPVGFYVLLENITLVAGSVRSEPEITLFLATGAGSEAARDIEARLKAEPEVREFRFIPRDQALQELIRDSGLEDAAAGLEKNPLPDAFVVHPRSAESATVEKLRDRLKQLPQVEAAMLDSAWVKRLNAIIALGQNFALILAALLGFALVAVTGNTIRLQVLSQREEIEVSKFIGATDTFIRRPFLYHGTLQGLGGGLAAWGIVTAGGYLLNAGVTDLARLYGVDFRLAPLGLWNGLGLLAFSGMLGWLGAFVAASEHLRRVERPV